MIIETKFDMFEMVGIVPLEGAAGRVMKITKDCNDLWYDVEYWHEGLVRVVTLMEFDLSKRLPEDSAKRKTNWAPKRVQEDSPF